jgi:hypothetical protein
MRHLAVRPFQAIVATALLGACTNRPIDFTSDAGIANALGGAAATGGAHASGGSTSPGGAITTGGAAATGGIGGTSVVCGGKICGSNEFCCGSSECGECFPVGSDVLCVVTCATGGSGSTGGQGAGGAAAMGGQAGVGGGLQTTGGANSSGGTGSGNVPLQHRSTSASCPSQRGPGPSCVDTMCSTSCSSDSQCIDGVNGRCFPWKGLISSGGCAYDECFTDSNCGAKTPCICRSSSTDNSANMCDVGGNCAVDSDCGPGGYCSPSMETCNSTNPEARVEGWYFGGPNPYYCHTASDLCINDSDCASLDAGTATTPSCPTSTPCAYNAQHNRWECTELVCCLP